MKYRIIGWSLEGNTPWLGVPRGFRLRRDHWIAGKGELSRITRALEKAIPGSSSIVRDRLVLLHKVPAPEGSYNVEVYSSAVRLGLLEYSNGSWRFKPSGAFASILLGIGYQGVNLSWKGRVKGKKVRLDYNCPDGFEYIIVVSRSHVGPARIIDKEKCIVRVRDMAPKGFKLLGESDINDAIIVNRAYIERLAAEAVEFIKREVGDSVLYVAVSGGIDSGATLSLAVEALGRDRVRAVYADTGMEFPESLRTVERLSSELGVDLVVVESGRDPLHEMMRRGLMSRSNRWCTRLLKLAPLSRYYRRVGARIVADGARALESETRATTPRVGVNPLIPFVKRILPIHSWSRLEVQLYSWLRGLPVNPLYDKGLERIGCIVCPAMHRHELELARRLEPGFYVRLYDVLRGRGIKEPEKYLFNGEWK